MQIEAGQAIGEHSPKSTARVPDKRTRGPCSRTLAHPVAAPEDPVVERCVSFLNLALRAHFQFGVARWIHWEVPHAAIIEGSRWLQSHADASIATASSVLKVPLMRRAPPWLGRCISFAWNILDVACLSLASTLS